VRANTRMHGTRSQHVARISFGGGSHSYTTVQMVNSTAETAKICICGAPNFYAVHAQQCKGIVIVAQCQSNFHQIPLMVQAFRCVNVSLCTTGPHQAQQLQCLCHLDSQPGPASGYRFLLVSAVVHQTKAVLISKMVPMFEPTGPIRRA